MGKWIDSGWMGSRQVMSLCMDKWMDSGSMSSG